MMIGEMFTPCTALLAHTLDLPWINHWPIAPVEPFNNAQWAGSNRRLNQPNPLSYYPQFRSKGAGPTTQHLVGPILPYMLQRLESQLQVRGMALTTCSNLALGHKW